MKDISTIMDKSHTTIFNQKIFTIDSVMSLSGNTLELSCSDYDDEHIDIFRANGYKNICESCFYKEIPIKDHAIEITVIKEALLGRQSIMQEYANGDREWRLDNGKKHRIGGPAVMLADGDMEWWLDGLLHRIDGPAIVYKDGSKEWYLNDCKLSEEEYLKQEGK